MNNLLYIHKLNAQELGYRTGIPGGAGRYIYISKKCIKFFPPLSVSVKNDHIILDIIPPHSDTVVFTNYIYHNDKITDSTNGTRNEFRLYLNEGIDPRRDYYKPGDIVVIRSIESEGDLYYKMYRYSQIINGSEMRGLEQLLHKYDEKNGTHALVPIEELAFLHLPDSVIIDRQNKLLTPDVKKVIFDEPVITENQPEEEFTRKVRDANFRDFVLMFWHYKCAITGREQIIKYGNLSNLEAAHIYAFHANGGNNPSNGIPLIRDLHWAFDNGFFTITEDYKVKIHPEVVANKYLAKLEGQQLHLPEDSWARPNKDAIKWHNEKVFGLFLKKQELK